MSQSILFVHHGSIDGGAPFSMLYTMQLARDLGYKPSVLLLMPSPELYRLYEDEGFPVHELLGIAQWYYLSAATMSWKRPGTYKHLAKLLFQWNPSKRIFQQFLSLHSFDIVHLNSVVLINLAISMKENHQQYVWHVREFCPSQDSWIKRFFRRNLQQTDELIFLGRAEQVSWLGNDTQGTVIHNFVPTDRFNDSVDGRSKRLELGLADSTPMLLFVGGIRKHKGGLTFLTALQQIRREHPELEFVACLPGALADDPALGEPVLRLIDEHGLSDVCRPEPFRTNINEYFAACDLLCFPSEMPHFARPVVEAAALSKPVVISDIPPMTDYVNPGHDAYVCRQGDANSLAEQIIAALSDRERMAEMGKRLHESFQVQFSPEAQSEKLGQVYRRLLSK
ncbi:MAG: glycosyltransferase family 4 protein [Planctomycetales bacterium]|nr:glycosyltransferase family 4 protein [Planctomycetales bacterium]